MPKKKLQRYAALKKFDNVFELGYKDINGDFFLKGKWHKTIFKNNHPITLELGCGKGEYTIALAEKYPEVNFIGVDLKGDRIWKGANAAAEKKLNNVAFIRTQIQCIETFFANDEVSEIWLTFPDPQLQKPRHRKRLSSEEFLHKYKNILKKHGLIHLKTDNTPLFEYTIDTIKNLNQNLLFATNDLYSENLTDPILFIKTHFEELFSAKGEKIKYLKFSLDLK